MSKINSYATAKKRFDNLEKRMNSDDQLKTMICEQIEKLKSEGYIEAVPEEEKKEPGAWYLPLHPVFNPKKPGKVRLTKDAAAKTGGRCLNDFLAKGLDLTNSLVEVLLQSPPEEYYTN